MKKGDIAEVLITDMASDGKGIGHFGGVAVFVEGAVEGDLVRAEITRAKKRYALARCVEILELSADRRTEPCEYIENCGGCAFGKLKYEKQLEIKRRNITEKLKRIGGIADPVVRDIIPAYPPIRYRNKAVMAVSGRNIGFNARYSHEVTDCLHCELQVAPAEAIADALRKYISGSRRSDSRGSGSREGMIEKLTVKTAFATGEVMAVIQTNEKELHDQDLLIRAMADAVAAAGSENDSLYILRSVALSDERGNCRVVYGNESICDIICGLNFEISPLSFYQVNPRQAEKLYRKAAEYADLRGGENVLDLYCGVGTIGSVLASSVGKRPAKIVGIESVEEAVRAAKKNARANNIENAVFYAGRAEDIIAEVTSKEFEGGKVDIAVLDPPRSGCDEKVLAVLAEAMPEKIVYVSCDPATMSRDIKYLAERGYTFKECTPVDMFPQTGHVEALTLLAKC